MDDDGEKGWARQLLVGVAALLLVAVVVGGVVGAFALGAARVSGLDDARTRTTAKPTLVMPSDPPATGTKPRPRATRRPTPSAPGRPVIELRADPPSVRAGQRINLTGDYRGGNGALLQVQRLEGGWVDFPVTMSVDGGRFSTWVQSTRTGDSAFRVVDTSAGRSSNVVHVTIG